MGVMQMFKAIFGFLGLLIALAIVIPLAKPYLVPIWQSGQATTRVISPTTTSAVKPVAAQPASSSGAQKSVFGRTDDAWRKSKERYDRSEP
jgi:hypothetical protein